MSIESHLEEGERILTEASSGHREWYGTDKRVLQYWDAPLKEKLEGTIGYENIEKVLLKRITMKKVVLMGMFLSFVGFYSFSAMKLDWPSIFEDLFYNLLGRFASLGSLFFIGFGLYITSVGLNRKGYRIVTAGPSSKIDPIPQDSEGAKQLVRIIREKSQGEDEEKYCPDCGAKLQRGDKFCSECGSEIEGKE